MGAPDRKVSIYPDAALCMLMIDLEILKNTDGKESLHSVMKELYENFALKNKGYSEDNFRNICVNFGGLKVVEIFKNHIYGTEDYIPTLKKSLEFIGLELQEKKNPNLSAQYFGFVAIKENGKIIIKKVEPDSIADRNGIGPEDELMKINNKEINSSLTELLKKCDKEVAMTIKNKFSEKTISLTIGNHYKLLEFIKKENTSDEQLIFRKIWGSENGKIKTT